MGFPVSTTDWPRTSPSVPKEGQTRKRSAGAPPQKLNERDVQLTVHGDGADGVLSKVHGDLEDEAVLEALNLESVEDRGKVVGLELDL